MYFHNNFIIADMEHPTTMVVMSTEKHALKDAMEHYARLYQGGKGSVKSKPTEKNQKKKKQQPQMRQSQMITGFLKGNIIIQGVLRKSTPPPPCCFPN